jgi:hypothetical protein
MRNTGRESGLQNRTQQTSNRERRAAAMRTDRVLWFRLRKSI